jgi:spermidine synthase
MPSRIRAFLFSFLIYVAFFCSGAGSLVAEVTWNRMLIVVVGNSLSATAMIIAIFMGGLGLGSYLGGRLFARRRVGLAPYMGLELMIGLFVVISPLVFAGLSQFFYNIAEGGINSALLTASRIVVTVLALLIPALLMGATFPAMIAGTALDSATRRTARTGYLYSINTLGAALGCFAAGYHLLFEFGVQFSLNVALVLYLTAASSAFLASRLGQARSSDQQSAPDQGPGKARSASPLKTYLYGATFCIGFVSLAYEVLLTRVSILFLGNGVSVFSLVLTAFLLGTGLSAVFGTWVYGWLGKRTGQVDRLFGLVTVLAGAGILLTPYLLLSEKILGLGRYSRLADGDPVNPLPILGLLVIPTVLIGGLLPLAIRMLNPEQRGQNTREAATLYTLNTIGGVIGAALANHHLVPVIGVQGVVLLLAGILIFWGLVQGRDGILARNALRAGVATAAVLCVLLVTLPSLMHLYADKVSRGTLAEAAKVLLVQEGKAATVTVVDQDDPRRGSYRDMYLNGVEEASTRYWHVQLFKLLGILPPVLHESDGPKDAMVIAFGAGITAGSVLASDEVGSLDVADLNPDIEGINDLFTEVNGDVFHKDRFHFHNEDGRNFLLTSGKDYDLIIGDSTHPRAYDSWILYTREFYELVSSKLKPGGIFAQWVPVLGSMRGELMSIHLNTFQSVFPNTTFWYIYGSDQAFLLATPEPLTLDSPRMQAKLDRLPDWFRAEEYQVDSVSRVAGFFWLDGPAMQQMIAGETRINSDDTHYFGKQSAIWPKAPRWQLPAFQASIRPYLQGADPGLLAAVDLEQQVAGRLANYGFFGAKGELEEAYCAQPSNGNARYFMGLEVGGEAPEPRQFCLERDIARYTSMLASHPDNPRVLNALAATLTDAGRYQEALPHARKAVDLASENGMILDTLGWTQYHLGQWKRSAATLGKANKHLPDHPIVLYHLGVVHHHLENKDHAQDYLEDALELAENHPHEDHIDELLQLYQE